MPDTTIEAEAIQALVTTTDQAAAAQPQSGVVAQALVTTDQMDIELPDASNQSYYSFTWKLDTCASAHMTSDIGLFEHLEPNHRVVRVGGDNNLLSEGIGIVILHAALLDKSVKILRLKSVSYLCHSLVSWGMLSEKRCVLTASGNLSVVAAI